jgi:coiled-coil domain-containing protein 130
VRFNAKKVQAGSYFTTKIWEFQMKCPNCKGAIVIRTDPKNCDYEFAEGIKKREQEYDEADIGLPTLPAPGESSATAVSVDPLVALERRKDDRRKADAASARLEELMALSERTEADNYGVNSLLRQRFRGEKKAAAALEEESLAKGLRFRLAPAEAGDGAAAARALTGGNEGSAATTLSRARKAGFKKDAKSKFAQIMGSSIFGESGGGAKRKAPPAAAAAAAASSSSSALMVLKRGGQGGAGGSSAGSKAVRQHEAKQALAVKRAKLGIDPSLFVINGGSGGGGGGGKASALPAIARKKA